MKNIPLITFIFGTRPEAIKMAPVIKLFGLSKKIKLRIILTGQHKEMVNQVMQLFDLREDLNINIMKKGQSLTYITRSVLEGLDEEFIKYRPSLLLVQGDTSTAFSAALAAFYQKIPIGHIEAGLRTKDPYNPFPEETNRRLISQLASIHFAPTELSKKNLIDCGAEGIIKVTGNTVIDALQFTSSKVKKYTLEGFDYTKNRLILVTVHRRENWANLIAISNGLKKIVKEFPDVVIIFPMHINPIVRNPIKEVLDSNPRVFLTEPLDYYDFVSVLKTSTIIISDSGGIQEEAPTFGKPLLILRNNTERQEAIDNGVAKLVGTNPEKIFLETRNLLNNAKEYNSMSKKVNPFGDGKASQRILDICNKFLNLK